MNTLIPTEEGYVSASAIEEVVERADGRGSIIRLRPFSEGSSRARMTHLDVDDIEEFMTPVVPATPGFFIVWAFEGDECGPDGDEKGWTYGKEPVVAWRITRARAVPVSPADKSESPAVLCPDGSVLTVYNGSFRSTKEWLESEAREAAKHRAAVDSMKEQAGKRA